MVKLLLYRKQSLNTEEHDIHNRRKLWNVCSFFYNPPWTNAMYTLCLQVDVKIYLKYSYHVSSSFILQQLIKCGCADFDIPKCKMRPKT
jgi:hypothetical protein